MKTTKAEVQGVFKLWLTGINGREARSYGDVGGYRLDYNSAYGGYRVEQVCNEHGGVADTFASRLPAWEFVTALRIAMRSIEEMRLNTKEQVTR